jgi:glutamate--cysteine ligase
LTVGDWALHISTLFPDVRLRRGYLEVRTLDTLPLSLAVAVAALLKGLLCDPEALGAWRARMPGVPEARTARRMVLDAARLGPRWIPDRGPGPVEAMTLLLEASARGLASLGEEDSLLAPLQELVGRAVCPADLWRRDGSGVWRGPEDPAPVF